MVSKPPRLAVDFQKRLNGRNERNEVHGNGKAMFEMRNENLARLRRGLPIAVGNRKNRILFYQFLAAEIRALHSSHGVGDAQSCKRALKFLANCERFTLRSLARRSAEHQVDVTVERAKRIFFRALRKLDSSQPPGNKNRLSTVIMGAQGRGK